MTAWFTASVRRLGVQGWLAYVLSLLFAVTAQADAEIDIPARPGMPATSDERMAWQLLDANQTIAARELAEKILKHDANSYVSHLVLGHVQHYAEGNFPRALFHLTKALELYEKRHGRVPNAGSPWRWHSLMLRELGSIHYDLEHYDKRLAFIDRYNEYYRPLMIAERAWPLMKLRRFNEARKYADVALKSGNEHQEALALNALCAIEFEAGDNQSGYQACRRAVEHARQQKQEVSAVDLSNLAEASRSLFRLDEAERISLEASKTGVSWYANPWLDLTELYTRQGRFAEALSALKQLGPYRAKRPPHVRDVDRAEVQRAMAAFLLVIGQITQAAEVSSKALQMPDRRAHTSRDEEQDRAIVALLDRRAQLMLAQLEQEHAIHRAWPVRAWVWLKSQRHYVGAWASGRRAVRLLAEPKRLVGTFQIGTAQSAIMPPWLVSELIDVLGAAVVQEALTLARKRDHRPGAAAYYTAFEAEVRLQKGDEQRALRLAERALEDLGPSEVLLRMRVAAVAAEAARRMGELSRAAHFYEMVFHSDPGVLRRLAFSVPVRVVSDGSSQALEVAKFLKRSPRFDAISTSLLVLNIRQASGAPELCLLHTGGAVIHCTKGNSQTKISPALRLERTLTTFQEEAFAPRLELSQVDINSLDGSNVRTPDALHSLFNQWNTGKW